MLGEFSGPAELVAAARAIREQGYRRVEAYSPFPIHGIDDALAAPKPILPWVVLVAGLTGCAVAVLMQWYMNAVEMAIPFSGYQYRISGKPFWSLPANIPVTFELIILFSAFTAFLGMIAFNKLPRLSNPLFLNKRFLQATDNGFFLLVESDDPQFAEEDVRAALESIGSTHVEPIEGMQEDPIPRPFIVIGGLITLLALLPPVYIAFARGGVSQTPRLSIWWDMDYQPKAKAQTESNLFADRRAMRLPVAGTVARGGLRTDTRLHLGYEPEGEETFGAMLLLQEEGEPGESPPAGDESGGGTTAAPQVADESAAEDEVEAAAEQSEAAEEAGREPAEGEEKEAAETPAEGEEQPPGEAAAEDGQLPPAEEEKPWITEFPSEIDINEATIRRGRERYDIHCAVCHGLAGDGDGLVALRARQLEQPTWLPPLSLHTDYVRDQPVGKTYHTVTKGIRKMAGYEEHIALEDRWAIVLYVKALQKTRYAQVEDLSEQERRALP